MLADIHKHTQTHTHKHTLTHRSSAHAQTNTLELATGLIILQNNYVRLTSIVLKKNVFCLNTPAKNASRNANWRVLVCQYHVSCLVSFDRRWEKRKANWDDPLGYACEVTQKAMMYTEYNQCINYILTVTKNQAVVVFLCHKKSKGKCNLVCSQNTLLCQNLPVPQ